MLGLFTGSGSGSSGRYVNIYVLSLRCNEPLVGQVDLVNELSRTDDGDSTYYTRKVIHTTGERRCFTQVEVELYFDQNKKILRHEVTGGRWLTAEEYDAELERFNAPPPEEEEDAETAAPPTEGQAADDPTTPGHTAADQTANDQPKGSE